MNKYRSLTLLQLKDFMGKYRSSLNVGNHKLGSLLLLLILIALISPAVSFSTMTFRIFDQFNHPELVITFMYVNFILLSFFLGLPFIISVFFFSKDLKFLTALPIREDVIVFSKLSTVYLYLLAAAALLMGPGMVIYSINAGFSFSFLILAIFALILAPILSLLISALLIIVVSSFISFSKHRNIFAILSNLLLVFGIMITQLSITKYMNNPQYLQQVFDSKDGLLGYIGLRFPPSIWLTRMLLGSVKETILFLMLNLILIWILQLSARKFYKRTLSAFTESYTKGSGKIYYTKKSKGYQLLKRNILIILKQPIFLLNTLMSILVPVIMYGIFVFTNQISLEILDNPQIQPYKLLIFIGIIAAPTIIANISATAITREGQAFWEIKILPISSQENIRYRILTTIIFTFLGTALLLILSLFIFSVTIKMLLIGLAFTICITLFLATADFVINIYRPLLNWTNPTAAVKNNLNIILSLGIRAVIALIYYLVYKLSPELLITNLELTVIISSLIFFGLYLVTRHLLYTYYSDVFSRISI